LAIFNQDFGHRLLKKSGNPGSDGATEGKDEHGSALDRSGSGLKPILAGSGLDRTAFFFKIGGSGQDRTGKIFVVLM